MITILKIIKDYKYTLQVVLIVVGLFFIFISSILPNSQSPHTQIVSVLVTIGGSLVAVPVYDIILRKFKKYEADEIVTQLKAKTDELIDTQNKTRASIDSLINEYHSHISNLYGNNRYIDYGNRKTTYVLLDNANILSFVNIGSFNDVITGDFRFSRLITDEEYIGQTVWVIGTSFSPLGTQEVLEQLKNALTLGVNFKFVLTEPSSIYLTERSQIDRINAAIANIRQLYTWRDNMKGTFELRVCPFDDRLHSFSLFENEHKLIATLDFNFVGTDETDRIEKFSQLFCYNKRRNQGCEIDGMLMKLIKHYKDCFDMSIPYLKYSSIPENINVIPCIMQNGKILVKKRRVNDSLFEDLPRLELMYENKKSICDQIYDSLYDSFGLNNKPIQFLWAFKGGNGQVYLLGEVINSANSTIKKQYSFVSLSNFQLLNYAGVQHKVVERLKTIN